MYLCCWFSCTLRMITTGNPEVQYDENKARYYVSKAEIKSQECERELFLMNGWCYRFTNSLTKDFFASRKASVNLMRFTQTKWRRLSGCWCQLSRIHPYHCLNSRFVYLLDVKWIGFDGTWTLQWDFNITVVHISTAVEELATHHHSPYSHLIVKAGQHTHTHIEKPHDIATSHVHCSWTT